MSNLIGIVTVEYVDPFTDEIKAREVEQRTCVVCGETFICKIGHSEGFKDTLYCPTHLREHNENFSKRQFRELSENDDGVAPQ